MDIPITSLMSWAFDVFILPFTIMIFIFCMFKALKEGDELMNAGRLKQALPYYEKVMQAADFKVNVIISEMLACGKWTSLLYSF